MVDLEGRVYYLFANSRVSIQENLRLGYITETVVN